MSSPSISFGWWPGRRATARRRAQIRHRLAALDFTLAELAHELKQLAEISRTADQDDSAAVVRESAATARILALLARGESLASGIADTEIADGWQRVAASTGKARLLGQGPHRAIKLAAAATDCEALQQIVDEELATT